MSNKIYDFSRDREQILARFGEFSVWPTADVMQHKDNEDFETIVCAVASEYRDTLIHKLHTYGLSEKDIPEIDKQLKEYFYECHWLKGDKSEKIEED